ncbi:reverse transcriptase domain-containing protein [Tanacetum coccineum]
MSTRSSARQLLSPIEDPERLLSQRNRREPSLLFDLEEDDMAEQAPPQGLIPDLCSMEELLQAPTDGVRDAIIFKLPKTNLKLQDITTLTKQVEALLSLHRLVNSIQNGCETCGGPHAYYECQAAGGYTQEDVYAATEKLEELANTPINTCSAILLNKVPEKLEDPGKFLIPCILQNLEVCNSLADSGASINLMPLSIYEKLGIGPLKPTRMTLELANRSVTFPMGIAEDVIVKVEKFNFLADFVIIDFEADPRLPIILGRPFLHTAKALVDLYEEKLTLRVGNEEVVFYTNKSSRNNSRNIQSVHCINVIDFLKDKPISGSTTFPSDSSPSLTPFEMSDSLLEEFADELALLDPFPPGN